MVEIRRITEPEAGEVVEMWDRMCRETPDGGPLRPAGRRNLERMLAMSAWHHERFTLVAVRKGKLVGFVTARVDPGDGLLPCLAGEVEECYAVAGGDATAVRRGLAEAVVAELRRRGAATIRHLVDADDPDGRQPWQELGFAADMVCLSLYRES